VNQALLALLRIFIDTIVNPLGLDPHHCAPRFYEWLAFRSARSDSFCRLTQMAQRESDLAFLEAHTATYQISGAGRLRVTFIPRGQPFPSLDEERN
jgi:hypothetical protein